MCSLGMLAFTIFFYVAVYTMGSSAAPHKHSDRRAAGAFPPMISWWRWTGRLDLGAMRFSF